MASNLEHPTEIVFIPIHQLELWEEANVRKQDALANIEDLARNIAAIGIQVPLLVKEDKPDQKYLVFSGQRRLEAAKIARLTRVPCLIFKNITVTDAQVLSLSENLYRQPMNQDDIARAANTLYKEMKSMKKVSVALGVSEGKVKSYMGYDVVPPPIREFVRRGDMTPFQAVNLYAKFPEEKQAEKVAELYTKIKNRTERAKLTTSIKLASPKDDVDAILVRTKRLGEMKTYEILLPPEDSNTVEKLALKHRMKGGEVLEVILENWLEQYRSGKQNFYEQWLDEYRKEKQERIG